MKKIAIALLVSRCGFVSGGAAQEGAKPAGQDPAKPAAAPAVDPAVRAQLPSYPLDTCVVSGEKLGGMGAPVEHVVSGRLVRLCCKGCAKELEKDPKAAIAKVDAAVVAAQKPTYPLDACAVTGEKLGAGAVDHVHGTKLVRLANAAAVEAFQKDPAPAMAKVDQGWIRAQLPKYAAKKCVVTDEELGGMGEPHDYLYGTRLVRFCCKGCVRTFEKDPAKYAAKLN